MHADFLRAPLTDDSHGQVMMYPAHLEQLRQAGRRMHAQIMMPGDIETPGRRIFQSSRHEGSISVAMALTAAATMLRKTTESCPRLRVENRLRWGTDAGAGDGARPPLARGIDINTHEDHPQPQHAVQHAAQHGGPALPSPPASHAVSSCVADSNMHATLAAHRDNDRSQQPADGHMHSMLTGYEIYGHFEIENPHVPPPDWRLEVEGMLPSGPCQGDRPSWTADGNGLSCRPECCPHCHGVHTT